MPQQLRARLNRMAEAPSDPFAGSIVGGILAGSVLASVPIKEKKKEETFGGRERAAGGEAGGIDGAAF